MFSEYLGVIESISRLGERATVGNIQKMNLHLSRRQVERVLKSLVGEGYVSSRTEPYGRTGKNVYYLMNILVTNVFIMNKSIEEAGYHV